MPLYDFACKTCGRFETSYTMADVPKRSACPRCGADSRRMFTAIGLSSANSAAMKAIDRAARSAESPEVVGGPPRPVTAPRVTTDPRHRKLPRP